MAFKKFTLNEQTLVIYKRRNSRNLKLSLTATGEIHVSIPLWAPYASGLKFAESRYQWIQQQSHQRQYLYQGLAIGKAHHLVFVQKSGIAKPTSRISGTEITISYPDELSITSNEVQKLAETASLRAMRAQAESLLASRMAILANQHDYHYTSLGIKKLKGRWGSCDHQSNIILNLFLMQLPWECIDYVILHELVHTKVMRHGPDFWQLLEAELPNAKALRKQIKQYQPVLNGSPAPAVA